MTHAQQELCVADRIGRYNKKNYWDQCVGNYLCAMLLMRDSFPQIQDTKLKVVFEKHCLKHYEKALDLAKKSERISTKEINKRELEKIKLRKDKIITTIDETKKDLAADTKEKEQDSRQLIKDSKSNAVTLLKELKLKHKMDLDSTKVDNERFVAQLAAEGDKDASLIRNMNKEALVDQKKKMR